MSPAEEETRLPFSETWPRAGKFALSACAEAVAELVTFPLDLMKTRLQVQGEAAVHCSGVAAGQTVPYRGMLRTAAGIVQEEGLQKLWQGATPAVYRHIGDYLARGGTSLDPAFCGQKPFGASLPYHLVLQLYLHRLLQPPLQSHFEIYGMLAQCCLFLPLLVPSQPYSGFWENKIQFSRCLCQGRSSVQADSFRKASQSHRELITLEDW